MIDKVTDFINLDVFLNTFLARLRVDLNSFQVDERWYFGSYSYLYKNLLSLILHQIINFSMTIAASKKN